MVIFHSYVSLPEGIDHIIVETILSFLAGQWYCFTDMTYFGLSRHQSHPNPKTCQDSQDLSVTAERALSIGFLDAWGLEVFHIWEV